jgi:glyoxylase-like metal-dependent hydrolase (beta-lactamase superfamily II)
MAAHIERVVTSGPAGPEGGGSNENNSRLIADEDQVLVVDAAHGVGQVTAAVRGRRVAIARSHGHADHVNQARAVATAVGAPTMAHRSGQPLWDQAPYLEEWVGATPGS